MKMMTTAIDETLHERLKRNALDSGKTLKDLFNEAVKLYLERKIEKV